jgi:hypothetical protein
MANEKGDLLGNLARDVVEAALAAGPKPDKVKQYLALVDEQIRQVGQALRDEMQQMHERHRQELSRKYEQETQQLRRRALWQWVTTSAALVAAVVAWLTKG